MNYMPIMLYQWMPKRASQVLRDAVEDCIAVEKGGEVDRRTKRPLALDAFEWFYECDGACLVCMAGSYFRRRGQEVLGAETIKLSMALNWARKGIFAPLVDYHGAALTEDLDAALRTLVTGGRDLDSRFRFAPWSTYLQAADMLAKAGL